jgi:hypothetical protein
MAAPDSAADLCLAVLLDEAVATLRAGRPVNLADWQARYPDFVEELPALLSCVDDLDSGLQELRSAKPGTAAQSASGKRGEC